MSDSFQTPLPTTGSHLIFHVVIALSTTLVVHGTLTVWHDPLRPGFWHGHVNSWRDGATVHDLKAHPLSLSHVSADADSRGAFAGVISGPSAQPLNLSLARTHTGEWIGFCTAPTDPKQPNKRHPARAQMLAVSAGWADPHAMHRVTETYRTASEPKHRAMPTLPQGSTVIHNDRPLMPLQVRPGAERTFVETPIAQESARNLISFCRSRGGAFGTWLPFSRLKYEAFLRSRSIKPSALDPFAGLMSHTYSVDDGYKGVRSLLVDLGGGTIGITDAFVTMLERSTRR